MPTKCLLTPLRYLMTLAPLLISFRVGGKFKSARQYLSLVGSLHAFQSMKTRLLSSVASASTRTTIQV